VPSVLIRYLSWRNNSRKEPNISAREILQLGSPMLRVNCAPVKSFGRSLAALVADLRDTLYDFKKKN